MKFTPLVLVIASASCAAEHNYEYNTTNDFKIHGKYHILKPNYIGKQTKTSTWHKYEKYITVTKYRPASTVTAYKTIYECSKPSDNPISIYNPSVSKPNYPVPKSTHSDYNPSFPILYHSKSSDAPVYPKPNESTSKPIYTEPSQPSYFTESKPNKSTHNPAYPETSKSSSESNSKPTGSYPSGGLSEKTIEMLCRVNALRAEVGKKPYKIDLRLMEAAQKHSEDQAAHKQMSHVGSKIKYFVDRIVAAGYPAKLAGENVGANYVNIAHVMKGWRESPGHYKAIIGDFDCFGWGEKDRYYTQDFARGSECTNQVIPQCKSYPPFNPDDEEHFTLYF